MNKVYRLEPLLVLICCSTLLYGCGNPSQISGTAKESGKLNIDYTGDRPDFDEILKKGVPVRRDSVPRPDLLAAARATKDNGKILAALDRELKGAPLQFDLRKEQAMTLEKLGRKADAKAAYSMILWPPKGSGSNLQDDMRIVEKYLTLSESTNDKQGVQRAMERAEEILSKNRQNLSAKQLTKPGEIHAAIAYGAYREAQNAEQADKAEALIKKAIAKDPTVALYQLRYGKDLAKVALNLAGSLEDPAPAIAKWQEAKAVLEQACKAPIRTERNDMELENGLYNVNNYIAMAKHGFFRGSAAARKKPGFKKYTVEGIPHLSP